MLPSARKPGQSPATAPREPRRPARGKRFMMGPRASVSPLRPAQSDRAIATSPRLTTSLRECALASDTRACACAINRAPCSSLSSLSPLLSSLLTDPHICVCSAPPPATWMCMRARLRCASASTSPCSPSKMRVSSCYESCYVPLHSIRILLTIGLAPPTRTVFDFDPRSVPRPSCASHRCIVYGAPPARPSQGAPPSLS